MGEKEERRLRERLYYPRNNRVIVEVIMDLTVVIAYKPVGWLWEQE